METNNFKIEGDEELLLKEIYCFIKSEFAKSNLNFDVISFLFNLSLSSEQFDYANIIKSESIILYLFKSFYESGKF